MFSQLFGAYLVNEGIFSEEELRALLDEVSGERVKLGTIAVAEGLLSEEEAEEINQLQMTQDKRFGDIAVERGYLTEADVQILLAQQTNPFMKFIQLLFKKGCMTVSELERYLTYFQEQEGFTDEDMEALKHEDMEQAVSLFAFSAKPYVTDLVSLVLRNITRFITDDYYMGRIERVDEFSCTNMAVQRTYGDHSIYLALAAGESEAGFLAMASCYAKEYISKVDDYAFDVLGEFINTTSGLFATNLSHKGIHMDMEPPVAYTKQTIEGNGYIIPLYICGKEMYLYISVDSALNFSANPYEIKIAKQEGSKVTSDSKGSFVIVDDSALTRKILRQILEEEGYTVVAEAVNGAEAVEAYQKYHPDVITLDITMPVMDGVEALRQIVALDEKVKAVMITAAGQEKKVIEALKVGADKFVVKPFNKEQVLEAIKDYF